MTEEPEIIPSIYFLTLEDPDIIPGIYFLTVQDPQIIPGAVFLMIDDPHTGAAILAYGIQDMPNPNA